MHSRSSESFSERLMTQSLTSIGGPVRIAYVVNGLETGGVKSLLASYFRHIDRNRFEIDFVACRNGFAPSGCEEIEGLGGSATEVAPISNPVAYLADYARALKRGRCDIVQACMNSLNVSPLLAAKAAGVPVRISYNLSTSHPGEGKSAAKSALRPFGNLFATARAANSELAWDWLFGEGRASERAIVPNAIDLDVYGFDEGLRKRTRTEMEWDGFFVIGHVGRFEYRKSHLFLVDIFKEGLAREPRARLALVGCGSMKERVFGKVDELGIGDAVLDLGAIEDLNGLYDAFDCFVLSSFCEGLPVVGIEVQATGCPCVFSSEIAQEARASDRAVFVPLAEPASFWAEEALRFAGVQRRDGREDVIAHGFEAKEAARRLEAYYSEQLARSACAGGRK